MNKLCPHLIDRPHFGDALQLARALPDGSINCIVTSPPYWGLRDYGVDGQWGLEAAPAEYVAHLVVLFTELRRALRSDGVCWINLGDCYAGGNTLGRNDAGRNFTGGGGNKLGSGNPGIQGKHKKETNLKPKDLVGIPWMVAFALRDDGWYLRSDIIWEKPNPMPESVRDRPTKAHEYLFLLTKSEQYWYDAEAVKEEAVYGDHPRNVLGLHKAMSTPGQPPHTGLHKQDGHGRRHKGFNDRWFNGTKAPPTRNKRSVWTIPTQPYSGAHFATFPEALPTTCILAGCPKDGIVLDPFLGSGTVGQVAQRLGRHWIGFDLDSKNAPLIERRTAQQGLFS